MGQVVKPGPAGTEAPGRAWGAGEARLGFLEGEQGVSSRTCRLLGWGLGWGPGWAAASTVLTQNAQGPDRAASRIPSEPRPCPHFTQGTLRPPRKLGGEHPLLPHLGVCLVDTDGAGGGGRVGQLRRPSPRSTLLMGSYSLPSGGAPAFSHFLTLTRAPSAGVGVGVRVGVRAPEPQADKNSDLGQT